MTLAPGQPDLAAITTRQQQTWSSGDYSMIGSRLVLVSERLVDSCDLRAGWDVLDVAAGNGNATLAAARSGTHAVGIDYVPELLEDGRARALAEGLDVEFRLGDAARLPMPDDAFDATLSVFGSMFAPDHQRTADEIVRVTRAGGTVGLASWTPDGFIGEMFRVITSHVPGPVGVRSPLLWGTEAHLAELFDDAVARSRHELRTYTFRFTSAEDFVAFFRRWYGPALKAFEALDGCDRVLLAADLADLVSRHDRHRDGGSVAIESRYLESVLTLR
jgi:ubiquinone/menaquinone biosynthesis C-methylase UbiE